jgi:hypothetical protein
MKRSKGSRCDGTAACWPLYRSDATAFARFCLPLLSTLSNAAVLHTFFFQRSRSARPSEPQSTSTNPQDGWVSRALDITKSVAAAHDLAHIPSIKEIASVFMQMLEQIQVSSILLWRIVSTLILIRR